MYITVHSRFDSVLHQSYGNLVGNWTMVCYLLDGGDVFAELWILYQVDVGMHEHLKTLGLVGLFYLSYITILGKVPILTISDKHLCRTWHGH